MFGYRLEAQRRETKTKRSLSEGKDTLFVSLTPVQVAPGLKHPLRFAATSNSTRISLRFPVLLRTACLYYGLQVDKL